jgi:hypothetical protein
MPSEQGVPNLGNTCYFGATVQALVSVPGLTRAVVDAGANEMAQQWGAAFGRRRDAAGTDGTEQMGQHERGLVCEASGGGKASVGVAMVAWTGQNHCGIEDRRLDETASKRFR